MKSRIETDGYGRKKVIDACMEPCAIERGMRIIGGKWTGSLIYHLKDGPVRFNDLNRMLGGATKKMIDQRLKELEARGMVLRTVINDRPIAVTYELTELGRSALDLRKREALKKTRFIAAEIPAIPEEVLIVYLNDALNQQQANELTLVGLNGVIIASSSENSAELPSALPPPKEYTLFVIFILSYFISFQ